MRTVLLLLLCVQAAAFGGGAIFNVYIDGAHGTTGLQVRDRLENRKDIQIIDIPEKLRKEPAERRRYITEKADAVILCLPDEASIEANNWLNESGNKKTVLIDASTAFRTSPDFTYGFPELNPSQRSAIMKSKRISNPGCYPTGFVSLVRPLVDAGIISAGSPLTVNAVSGYTGGGKQLMEIYKAGPPNAPWEQYGFNMQHKHLKEMAKYSGLGRNPIFQPQVANFPQGMVVSVPLHYSAMKPGVNAAMLHDCLSERYAGSHFVKVMPYAGPEGKAPYLDRTAFLRPDSLANTNRMELFVFANDDAQQAVLCARLDNLGKGASGAAVQNMNLALGMEETAGLL